MTTPDARNAALISLAQSLAARTACLFLGAGVNAGLVRPDGKPMPLGVALAKTLARDALDDPHYDGPLTDVADMAVHRLGRTAVNKIITAELSGYQPGATHLALVRLPFHSIFTTNWDTLIEAAATHDSYHPYPIVSQSDPVIDLTDQNIPYYKLHGCLDRANTTEGRLTLTTEDYRFYDLNRKPLFGRLQHDITQRLFLFLGYALRDTHFRTLLDDCRAMVGALPHSYAIVREPRDPDISYWKDKYNVTLIDADATTFVADLQSTWIASGYSGLSEPERQRQMYFSADEDARFKRVGQSFFLVDTEGCAGESKPSSFFRGAPPTWADVRDGVPAERDIGWDLLQDLASEVEDTGTRTTFVHCVTGAAATGKTAIIKSVLWSLATNWNTPVFQHIPDTRLDSAPLRAFVGATESNAARRLVIYVPSVVHITNDILTFVHDLRQQKVPATVILEERSSLWAGVAVDRLAGIVTSTYELGTLSIDEIDGILESLKVFGALDRLEAYSEDERRSHFLQLADSHLLVALRELTTNTNFDQLVRDEYNNIPSTKGKEAYLYASAIGHIGLHLRYEVLRRLLGIDFGAFRQEVFAPTHGVLLTIEGSGGSKYTEGYRVRTRHPTIASIVFDAGAPSDAAKVKIIESLLSNLDLGFPEDAFLIKSIAIRRQLTQTIGAPEYKRAIFKRLEELLPSDPYVMQHRAILERELGNAAQAMNYAKRAVQLKTNDLALENTLGLAYEAAARSEADAKKRLIYRQEASKLFERGIEKDPGNPFGHIGRALLIQNQEAGSPMERAANDVELVSVLREAYEATDGHSAIAGRLAEAEGELGHSSQALSALREGLLKAPKDDRLRAQLAEVLLAHNQIEEAQKTLRDGIAISPMSWRLYRDLARVGLRLEKPITDIRSFYESSIRNRQGDPQLLVEFGAFLFQTGEYALAGAQFEKAHTAERQGKRHASRVVWRDQHGSKVFSGTVSDLRGGMGFVRAVPEGFEARFVRTGRFSALRQGEAVAFTIHFTAMGADARIGIGKPPG